MAPIAACRCPPTVGDSAAQFCPAPAAEEAAPLGGRVNTLNATNGGGPGVGAARGVACDDPWLLLGDEGGVAATTRFGTTPLVVATVGGCAGSEAGGETGSRSYSKPPPTLLRFPDDSDCSGTDLATSAPKNWPKVAGGPSGVTGSMMDALVAGAGCGCGLSHWVVLDLKITMRTYFQKIILEHTLKYTYSLNCDLRKPKSNLKSPFHLKGIGIHPYMHMGGLGVLTPRSRRQQNR